MASEDSNELVPGLPVVHGLGQPRDLDQSIPRKVSSRDDHIHALRELLEVMLLRGSKRMLAEERNDRLHEIASLGHGVLAQVLLVIVVPPIDEDPAYAKEPVEVFEAGAAPFSLRHHKRMAHLVSGLVASSPGAVLLPHEADREASFSVYETDHPATELDQSFLLVFRTRHVVTMVYVTSDDTG